MASFDYTAKDKAGLIKKGSLLAADRSLAAAHLIDSGLVPVVIKEKPKVAPKTGGFAVGKYHFGGKVKLKDKVIFSRQFATMINAGVPITQSLGILAEQATGPRFKAAILDMAKRVEGGSTLAAAMGEHTDIFNPIYINMIKAGESSGTLDDVLDRLATQQEKDAYIISKVRGAMIYPGVITTATIAAFIFLMTVIVPNLATIFDGLGGKLPWYTQLMLTISHVLTHYGILVLAAVGAAGFLGYRYAHTPAGKKQLAIVMLKAPIIGPIVVKVNVARFARTLGALMASGISVLDALETTSAALGNQVFREDVAKLAQQVKTGKTISEPLRTMKEFPPIVSQMVAVGEETGQLDTVLTKLAGFYEQEVDTVVAGLTSIIEPILIIVLGGMVGFIVISVFGPISALSNTI